MAKKKKQMHAFNMTGTSERQKGRKTHTGDIFEQLAKEKSKVRELEQKIDDLKHEKAETHEMLLEQRGLASTGSTKAAALERKIDKLFDAIKHGDELHQVWLEAAIRAHFTDKPMPETQGLGEAEHLRARMIHAVECLHAINVKTQVIRLNREDGVAMDFEDAYRQIEGFMLKCRVLLGGLLPDTYGDAIWLMDFPKCEPHEWDNRTSEENRRWLFKYWL